MTRPPAPVLDADLAAFVASDGLSINAASAGTDGFPNLARCLGCRLSPGKDRITLLLAATPAKHFLADIARNGCITAVFSEPASHRTVQLKGQDARQEAASNDDRKLAQHYRECFAAAVAPLGFPVLEALTLLAAPDVDLVAVSFAPQAAFSQTPGPQAGTPLGAPA